ncbi:hypothetical protein JAAARDRAFT_138073 [Jaapia argillacea MUCL 33604]|uniref:Pali-domain-containing protein n=1 Tax=Jaapia argillacea MUCL 33604 TaxID=933084 RepID=A0A067PDD7_9AGAM|nr:hypothetical protein JAAARDRAFT_138073 [Jaapia argillacea MUCL 33604]
MTRPLAQHRTLSIFICVVLFLAFLFFLLVALSLPIIKTIYLLSLKAVPQAGQPATDVATEFRFGVWGFSLGYQLSPALISLSGYPQLVSIVLHSLQVILVLHAVVAGLSFITSITSLFLASHTIATLSLLSAIFTAILSSIVFAVDLALTIVARNNVHDITIGTFEVYFGNAIWMVLIGMVLTWMALVALSARVCYCCGVRPGDKEGSARFPSMYGVCTNSLQTSIFAEKPADSASD